jgi:ribonuclease G
MSNELIINSSEDGGRIALLKDRKLTELHYDNDGDKFVVGDIYLGVVRNLIPSLNAAFVDVGYEKDAFLHYHDLGENVKSLNRFTKLVQTKGNVSYKLQNFDFEKPIEKHGKITEVFKQNQRVLVQVVKEPISSKGPRISCELSLAGRYLVLVPFSNVISISKKISEVKERKRLQRLIASIKPDNFGVIIRTVAENKEVAELDRDLRDLVERWEKGIKRLVNAKPRQLIIGEMAKHNSILRDLLNSSFDSITVDEQSVFNEIKSFIKGIAPEKENIVKLHKGRNKIFEHFGIERQVKTLFGKTVSMPKGGYLIIEHTEALHVIDVNSGSRSPNGADQETTAFEVNKEAAQEIGRQLRLRDMGGIIVIDFIDMRKAENRKEIYDMMKKLLKEDRSKATVLPLSKFGLMQITRQRVRPELNIKTQEVCPTCNGTGKIGPSIGITDRIESDVSYLLGKQNESGLSLYVNPLVYAHLTKGFLSPQVKWFMKYRKRVNIKPDSTLGVVDYLFTDKNQEPIEMK